MSTLDMILEGRASAEEVTGFFAGILGEEYTKEAME